MKDLAHLTKRKSKLKHYPVTGLLRVSSALTLRV